MCRHEFVFFDDAILADQIPWFPRSARYREPMKPQRTGNPDGTERPAFGEEKQRRHQRFGSSSWLVLYCGVRWAGCGGGHSVVRRGDATRGACTVRTTLHVHLILSTIFDRSHRIASDTALPAHKHTRTKLNGPHWNHDRRLC